MASLLQSSSAAVTIRVKTENSPSSDNQFAFAFAPEQPALGQPGMKTGDLLLLQNGSVNQILVSLGPKKECKMDTFRKAGGQAGKWLRANPAQTIDLNLAHLDAFLIPGAALAFLEGLRLGSYSFERYKQQPTSPAQTVEVMVFGANADSLVEQAQITTDAVILARDWAHEPANVINPLTLAQRATDLADSAGLRCRVLEQQELESLGAGAILAVGRGSQTPPCLIVLEYPGTQPALKPLVLVGKALTFDSGGYSLKDPANIQGMKYDKCGGVTVLALLLAAARLKIAQPLVGIIAAAENLVSSRAYRPDDILTTLSGKTVEIVSTDAEGRLVLADALTYAQQTYAPRLMVDLATLTGGVVTALGRVRAGVMGNDAGLIAALIEAGERTHERLWQLPLDDEYLQSTKGDDADLKNSGGREGHPILGGIFLKQFVADQIPWAHLDIAGVADAAKDTPYAPKGATGFGVRLLLDFIQHLP